MVPDTFAIASNTKQSFDRVRKHTASSINQKIDEKTLNTIRVYAHRSEEDLSERINQLEQEWDTERVLEANASVLAFTGLMLGIFIHQNWFWLPGLVLPFLFQHAVQGWCPPLPIIRRLGVRTPHEVDQEKYVLKMIRGDFSKVIADSDQDNQAEAVFHAART